MPVAPGSGGPVRVESVRYSPVRAETPNGATSHLGNNLGGFPRTGLRSASNVHTHNMGATMATLGIYSIDLDERGRDCESFGCTALALVVVDEQHADDGEFWGVCLPCALEIVTQEIRWVAADGDDALASVVVAA